MSIPVNDTLEMSLYLLPQAHQHSGNRFGALIFDDTLYTSGSASSVAATFLTNVTAPHAMAIFLNLLHRGAFNRHLGSTTAELNVGLHPMPLTGVETATYESFLSILAALFLLIPFSFVAANFVVPLVKERFVKAKHLLMTSGVNIYGFWAANLLW